MAKKSKAQIMSEAAWKGLGTDAQVQAQPFGIKCGQVMPLINYTAAFGDVHATVDANMPGNCTAVLVVDCRSERSEPFDLDARMQALGWVRLSRVISYE